MLTGPPPKFHGTWDILGSECGGGVTPYLLEVCCGKATG
jgi:hypothetical protein